MCKIHPSRQKEMEEAIKNFGNNDFFSKPNDSKEFGIMTFENFQESDRKNRAYANHQNTPIDVSN